MNRYQSYKPSGVEWIGEIPFEWRISKYKYNLGILSGFPFKSELFHSEVGFPLLRIRDITSGTIETYYSGDFDEKYIIRKGDVVIGMDGEFNIREWDNEDILLNQRCCKIQDFNGLLLKYIYYTLPFDLRIINDLTYYTTVKHLSVDDLDNIKCIIPPLSEQKQIVQFLDSKTELIDKLISTKECKITLLKEQRTSLINQIITKGLNPNVKMKKSGVEWIGEIPEDWKVGKLKHICRENLKSLSNNTNPDYELDYIEISDVNSDGLIKNTTHYTFSESPSRCRRIVRKGDIILSTVRTYLRSIGLIDNDVNDLICSTGFSVLTPNSEIYSKHLFYMVRTEWFISMVISKSEGVSYPSIQSEKLMNNLILILPKDEQIRIVEYLDSKTKEIDDLVHLEQKKIDLLKEYRQSLISEVVTGKVKVTTDE